MEDREKYGKLITPDIKLHRIYFSQMTDLIGIKVLYYAPRKDKTYTSYTEIVSNKEKPLVTGVIFEEHPSQQTLKKLGWVSELQENESIIHVPYDLPNIQQGAFFVIPSGIDCAEGRLFRVKRISNEIIYPASLSCAIVPEYEDTYSNAQKDYSHTSFNLLNEEN